MSNLLNEAIVDAKALREAALKNAETRVIEKYSDEVRNTLEKLLEQEEDLGFDPAGAQAEDAGAVEAGAAPVEEGEDAEGEEISEEEIPLAATDGFGSLEGKNLNNFSKAGSEVELDIDLGALQESISALTEGEDQEIDLKETFLDELLSELLAEEEELSEPLAMTGLETDGDETEEEALEEEAVTQADEAPQQAEAEADEDADLAMEEGVDIDSLVDAITEKLTVDMGADLTGWAGRSSADMKYSIEKELARRRSTDVEEDLEILKKAQEELVFENKQLTEQNSQYKQAFEELKENLQDVNLSNARLLYTNRVLRNTSLNERQKQKIVEAISSAGSVAEARTIYDTLQSTVEAAPKRSPKSLSEAIGRRSTVLRATRQEAPSSDPFQDRMKRLAGIK